MRSVSSRVLDSLVSSALRGLLGLHELVNLGGLFSDLDSFFKAKEVRYFNTMIFRNSGCM